MNNKIFIISLFLFILISLSCVSASSEDSLVNDTLELEDYADVEIQDDNSNLKDSISDNLLGYADEAGESSNETILKQTDNVDNVAASKKSFEDLKNTIDNTEDTVYLYDDYSDYDGSGYRIEKDITIDGQGHTIETYSTTPIFYIENGYNLTVRNINFVNPTSSACAVGLYYEASLTVLNCTFSKFKNAIVSSSSTSSVTVKNSIFAGIEGYTTTKCTGIIAKGTLTVDSSKFYNLHSSSGGAISAESGFNISNCIFENNSAHGKGGAIYTWRDYNVGEGPYIIQNCSFNNNYALGADGGALYLAGDVYEFTLSNCSFYNSYSESGGAVYCNENLILDGCRFENNSAKYHGGALYVRLTIKLTENPSIFINNHGTCDDDVKSQGGAIYTHFIDVTDYSYNVVKGFVFINNSAYYGGAVYLNNKNQVTFESCYFENNKADRDDGEGAAIYADSSSTKLSLINNIFANNEAHDDWGIYNCGSYVIIKNNWWGTNNPDFSTERRIIEWKALGSNIRHQDTDFLKITLSVDKDDPYTLVLKFTDSNGNDFTGELPAWDVTFTSNGNATFSNKIIENNMATVSLVPEEFFEYNVSAQVHDQIVSVTVKSIGDFEYLQKIIDNAPENSVISIDRDYNYTIGHDTITKGIIINKKITIEGNGHTIDASGKSRIFNILSDNVVIRNLTFLNGNGTYGGAVYLSNSENTLIEDCIFNYNNASYSGGAIYFGDGKNNTVVNSAFNWNEAKYYAGAIYLGSAYSLILNSQFSYNKAVTQDGGAIYSKVYDYTSSSTVNNSTFVYNEAFNSGGAIYWANPDNNVSYSNFMYNSANNGGAIYWRASNGYLTGSSFSNNSASAEGGAVKWTGLNGKVENSIFLDNKAAGYNINSTVTDEYIIVTFSGGENYINAIYSSANLRFNNVTYWNGQIVNTNNVAPVKSTNPAGQAINIEILGGETWYDGEYTEVFVNKTFLTDNNGKVIFNPYGLSDEYAYNYTITLADDRYYTNVTAHEGELAFDERSSSTEDVDLINEDSYTYGNVTLSFKVNDNGPVQLHVVIKDNNGQVFVDEIINTLYYTADLPASENKYTIEVENYNGMNRYTEASYDRGSFKVNKKDPNIKIQAIEYAIYGSTAVISFTGDEGLIYNIFIETDDEVINEATTSNSFQLWTADLSIGSCNLTVSTEGNQNYAESSDTIKFEIVEGDNMIYVTVDDVTYGEPAVIIVTSDVDGNYTVYINDTAVNVTVIDGEGNSTILLPAGEYYANVTVKDHNLIRHIVNDTFTVYKGISIVDIEEIDNVFKGEVVEVIINYYNAALFNIAVYDKDGKIVFNKTTNDAEINITITNDWDVGEYNITVVNLGNENIAGSNASIMFNITMNNTVEVNVDNETWGKASMIIVYADIDGNYTVDVNGTNINVKVKNGIGFNTASLKPGKYYANVTFNDNKYNNILTNTTFEVLKLESDVVISPIENIVEGEVMNITFTAKSDTLFNVTVYDSNNNIRFNQNTTGLFIDNITELSVSVFGLKVGEYTVTVVAFENENITRSEDSISFNVTRDNYISVFVDDLTYGENATFYIIADVNGTYTVDINGTVITIEVKDGLGNNTVSNLKAGIYYAKVIGCPDNYNNIIENATFEVFEADSQVNIENIEDIIVGDSVNIEFAGDNLTYFRVVIYDQELNIVYDANTTDTSVTVSDLGVGQYMVMVYNYGDENISDSFDYEIFEVINENYIIQNYVFIYVENVTYGEDSMIVILPDIDGDYSVDVNGKIYNVTVVNGEGYLILSLPVGKYYVNVTFNSTEYDNFYFNEEFSVLPKEEPAPVTYKIINNKNINMYYFDGSKYTVKVVDSNGKATAGKTVVIKLNKKTYKVKTNKNGIATLKIPNTIKPKATKSKKYTITATYSGKTVKNTVTVKQNLKSKKTVKVKKSAKKLVLKATLKNGKKAVKGKKITFKFKGKTYKAKTNKKGIAKVTIKKKVIKKLKKGKKYTVKVTYLKNTIKTKVKVK